MAVPLHQAAHDEERRQPGRVIDHPTGFAKVMNDVARSGRLSLQELGMYTLVLGYAGPEGECWQSHEELADHAQVTDRQLRRHLRALVDRGFLDERTRGHGQAKAYRRSERWRRTAVVQLDTGVRLNTTPVSASTRGNRTPVSEQQDTDVRFNRTPVSDNKKTPEKTTKRDPDTSGGGSPVGAAAPTAAAPPKGKAETRSVRSDEDGTDAPEPADFELTPALLAHGAKFGYDAERVELELFACLDWFGSRKIQKKNWVRTFRNWLTGERKRDLQRDAQGTPTAYRGGNGNGHRNGNGEPQWTGKPGSPTSTDARQIAHRRDWDL